MNYPERLSYSSTPPDFGSLVVQRRRWANCSLLIIGKFFRIVKARHKFWRDTCVVVWLTLYCSGSKRAYGDNVDTIFTLVCEFADTYQNGQKFRCLGPCLGIFQ